MGIDPDNAAGAAVGGGKAAERAEATEWSPPRTRRELAPTAAPHLGRDLRAGNEDLGQVAGGLVPHFGRLQTAVSTLPRSQHVVAEGDEPLLEVRVAHRRRAHVDAASALAEVGPRRR